MNTLASSRDATGETPNSDAEVHIYADGACRGNPGPGGWGALLQSPGAEKELWSRTLLAANFNWIAGQAPAERLRLKVKIRYRQPEQWAEVEPLGTDKVRLVFDEPQRAAAPGQYAVLYDGDCVAGGGVICRQI